MGGEKEGRVLTRRLVPGSPPHGRGKDQSTDATKVRVRITPAWAGKSRGRSRQAESTGDHPRMGGEKSI